MAFSRLIADSISIMMKKRTLTLVAVALVPPQELFRPVASFAFSSNLGSEGLATIQGRPNVGPWVLYAKHSDDFGDGDMDEDGEDDIALEDDDWRSFRAKLVMGENAAPSTPAAPSTAPVLEDDFDGIGALFADNTVVTSSKGTETDALALLQGMTPLDPSQWAYESGKVIEQGAVILGGVEQDFGFGLRQQYFHKAAILVLEHDEKVSAWGHADLFYRYLCRPYIVCLFNGSLDFYQGYHS